MKLHVKRSKSGLGLYAGEPIKKGEFVIEYTGVPLTNEEADARPNRYLFEVSSKVTIDGSGRDNKARYINHSCRPNCEANIKKGRIFISAIKNIANGEELTYDYGKEYFNEYIKPYGCTCASCEKKAKK